MKIHQLSVQEALTSLKSSPTGLSAAEARRRLHEYGPNIVQHAEKRSLILQLIKQFTHFFAILLWIAAILALISHFFAPHEGMNHLAIAIISVIIINGLFSFWQEYKAEKTIEQLRLLLPKKVTVFRDHKLEIVSSDQIVPGDVIHLAEGDQVSADARVISPRGESGELTINSSALTGESVPEIKEHHAVQGNDILHAQNIVLASSLVVSGQAEAIVFSTGMHTEFGKIAGLSFQTSESLSPIEIEVRKLSYIIAGISGALGILFFIVGTQIGISFWSNALFAIGIIVANVPEGLLPTVTLSLAMATRRMAKKNALVRHLPAVQALGSATVICTDKTGTLTENRMSVKRVFVSSSIFNLNSTSLLELDSDLAFHRLCETALYCNTLTETLDNDRLQFKGDPMEIALVDMAKLNSKRSNQLKKVRELSFNSDRKRLTLMYESNTKSFVYSKGALETILPLCSKIQNRETLDPLTSEVRKTLFDQELTLANQGLRVIAFAFKESSIGAHLNTDLEKDLTFVGLVGLKDPPRPEVKPAIQKCKTAGIRIIMLTGDHPVTGKAIGIEIGLLSGSDPKVYTGEQLKHLTDIQLQLALDEKEILFARLASDQKLRIVRVLRKKGEIVAVTGDGVNDAPALKEADVGVAMGRSGTDVARESSDLILLDDNFSTIVDAIEEGRTVFNNIRKFLTYILSSNVPELVPYLAFAIFKIPLALTIIQILAIDLGTDMIPALALGAERSDQEVMQRPPEQFRRHLIDFNLLARSYLFLGAFEALAAMTVFFILLHHFGWTYGESLANTDPIYLKATGSCLGAIILMQIVNVYLCRKTEGTIFKLKPLENKLILIGIFTEFGILFLVNYTSIGNTIFGTSFVPPWTWLYVLPFAIGMIILEEIRKWLLARFHRTHGSIRAYK